MKTETIFKMVALGAFVVGGIAIAQAALARVRKEEDEEKATEVMIEADSIVENFSGAAGCHRNFGSSCSTAVAGDVENSYGVINCRGRCVSARHYSGSASAASIGSVASKGSVRGRGFGRGFGRGLGKGSIGAFGS